MTLYFVEDMEHGWAWAEANSPQDAASQVAGEGCTATYTETNKYRGYPVHWYSIHDADGELVDDYQVSDEKDLPKEGAS